MYKVETLNYVYNTISLWELTGKLTWNVLKFVGCDANLKKAYMIRLCITGALLKSKYENIRYGDGYIFACVVSNLNNKGFLKTFNTENLTEYWNDKAYNI